MAGEQPVRLTDVEIKRRRGRNVALALGLVLLVVIFYAVTMVKGPGLMERPL